MPTQPDQTPAAAGTTRTSSGQDRTVVREPVTAPDRSSSALPDRSGPVVRAVEAVRGPGPDPASTSGHVNGQSSHADHHPSEAARGQAHPLEHHERRRDCRLPRSVQLSRRCHVAHGRAPSQRGKRGCARSARSTTANVQAASVFGQWQGTASVRTTRPAADQADSRRDHRCDELSSRSCLDRRRRD